MTLHRLTAGAGYRYLLRHIATGDCSQTGRDPVTTYYTQTGNPPGRWMGRGLPGLGSQGRGLPAGTRVVEEGMARLFAGGADPVTGHALGRCYPRSSAPAGQRVAREVQRLPADLPPAARASALDAIARVELARDAPHTVAGFDLTFTVMKSVSTLWAVADPGTQQAILEAHAAAVRESVRLLEDAALFTRTGTGGCRQEPVHGALAAAFDHWDSRAGDPNLHTHVVLANKVQGLDGAWRSLDSRALHHAVVTISEAYEAFLVDELARRLSVQWGWRSRGPRRSAAFELEGVDDALMRAFSQRSARIDEAMTDAVAKFTATRGRGPNRIEIVRLRQQVTRATRPAKTVHSLGSLLEAWRRRATETTGLSPAQLAARVVQASKVQPARAEDLPGVVIDELAAWVLTGVRERRSTWTRWNVMAETLRVTKGLIAATPDDRRRITDAVTDAVLARCVSLAAPAVFRSTGRCARPDGTSVFDRPGESSFTDAVILDAERDLLQAARDHTAPQARPMHADLLVDGRVTLADDQEAAVRRLAGSGRRVDVLVGPAGSGKTTTLAALRRVWERTHGRGSVIGLAPSSTAAANLAGALGIACENTAKWLHETDGAGAEKRRSAQRHLMDLSARRLVGPRAVRAVATAIQRLAWEDRRWTVHPGQLVIVDEASLAGTLALHALTAQVQAAGAKLLLVGDHAQLSAVDAGGAFGLLVDRTGGAHLRSLWRFVQPWEAAATARLRAGDGRVLEEYEEAGRLHDGPGESMLEEAYAAWSRDVAAGVTSILVAPDAFTVTALNLRAHNDRVQDGLVAPAGVTTAAGVPVAVGDRIVSRLNDRRLRWAGGYVRNGDLWDVRAVTTDGSLQVVPARTRLARRGVVGTLGSDDRNRVLIPAGYARQNVDLAYATTTHRAQGITVDRAHLLAHAGMSRENLYVGMTRGREENHVYVAVDQLDPDCDGLPDPHAPGDARDILKSILSTTGAERSATQTIAANLEEATSLRRLEAIAATLYADAAHARWTRQLEEWGLPSDVVEAVRTSPDIGRLCTTLDCLEHVGVDVLDLLEPLTVETTRVGATVALLTAANSELRRRVEDPAGARAPRESRHLDDAGRDLMAEIDELIARRLHAAADTLLHEPAIAATPQPGSGQHDAWSGASVNWVPAPPAQHDLAAPGRTHEGPGL